jgi:Na+-translocating ferredoxin:NAD+ oxidoreductase RNF subunit RnfB
MRKKLEWVSSYYNKAGGGGIQKLRAYLDLTPFQHKYNADLLHSLNQKTQLKTINIKLKRGCSECTEILYKDAVLTFI